DFGVVNPVHALARAIAQFADTPLPGGFRSSINVGTIEGGVAVNSIPTQARAKVDIRSESDAAIDAMSSTLADAVRAAVEQENRRGGAGPGASAKIREIGSRPAAELPADSKVLACLRAVDQHFGIRSQLDRASTDANVPMSLGRDAVTIGAGGQ